MSEARLQLPEPLDTQLTRYLVYLKNERAYSSHTISNYRRSLISLVTFLAGQDIKAWPQVTEGDLKQWLVQFRTARLKASSISLKLSAVKGLFNFLLVKRMVEHDPSALLQAPKQEKRLPKNIDVDEVSQLLNFTPEATIEFRDKAIMELFYSSGLRLSELASLSLSDLQLQQGELLVTGKGNKQRVVPVGRLAIDAIQQWIKVRGEFNKDNLPALFISKLGNRLSTRQIQQRLKYWAQRQGLASSLHPHKIRHSFATHMLESSQDLRAVQELLGHANLSTTQVYTHLDFQHLAKVYDSAHPRARQKDKSKT